MAEEKEKFTCYLTWCPFSVMLYLNIRMAFFHSLRWCSIDESNSGGLARLQISFDAFGGLFLKCCVQEAYCQHSCLLFLNSRFRKYDWLWLCWCLIEVLFGSVCFLDACLWYWLIDCPCARRHCYLKLFIIAVDMPGRKLDNVLKLYSIYQLFWTFNSAFAAGWLALAECCPGWKRHYTVWH